MLSTVFVKNDPTTNQQYLTISTGDAKAATTFVLYRDDNHRGPEPEAETYWSFPDKKTTTSISEGWITSWKVTDGPTDTIIWNGDGQLVLDMMLTYKQMSADARKHHPVIRGDTITVGFDGSHVEIANPRATIAINMHYVDARNLRAFNDGKIGRFTVYTPEARYSVTATGIDRTTTTQSCDRRHQLKAGDFQAIMKLLAD